MEERQGALEVVGMTPGFWKNKRIFLTGHTGFKGAYLSLWLQSLGAQVTGLALAPATNPSLFEVLKLDDGMTSVIGDIRDASAVRQAMEKTEPDIVIHMAAQALVRYSYTNPIETYATNVMGTVHVLDAVRHVPGIKAVVSVTSDKCYENRERAEPYVEDEAMGGHDPYSNSKGCAELVTAAYRNSYFHDGKVAVASGRAGNVIGGGDWATDRLIPDIIRAFARNEAVLIRAPKSIRPWQHVLEPLSGYLTLAEHLYEQGDKFASGWNFGPHDSDMQPVEHIVEHMVNGWGQGAKWKRDTAPQPHEANILKLDSTKARTQLGWRNVWALDEALDRIVAWHRAHLEGADMRAHTLADIATYQNG